MKSRQPHEADMKTQLIALLTLFAATPAGASIDASDVPPLSIAPQPAVYQAEPAIEPATKCGAPRQMIFILRDPSGAIVAMGVAQVPATC
jgi:hypothetical protein